VKEDSGGVDHPDARRTFDCVCDSVRPGSDVGIVAGGDLASRLFEGESSNVDDDRPGKAGDDLVSEDVDCGQSSVRVVGHDAEFGISIP